MEAWPVVWVKALGTNSKLAAIALPAYQDYIAKSQVSEAFTLADGLKIGAATNLQSNTCTSTVAAENTRVGKYGTAVLCGTPGTNTGDTDPSGCVVAYTFGSNASNQLATKVVAVNILNNASLVVNAQTTVDAKFIPAANRAAATPTSTP